MKFPQTQIGTVMRGEGSHTRIQIIPAHENFRNDDDNHLRVRFTMIFHCYEEPIRYDILGRILKARRCGLGLVDSLF